MADGSIGMRVKAFRQERGMTQRSLAVAADTRVMTISNWEREAVRAYDDEILERVAVALDVDVALLRYGNMGVAGAGPPSWSEWVRSSEAESALDAEKAIMRAAGDQAASEGYSLTPGVYSAWLVALRMFGRPPTKR